MNADGLLCTLCYNYFNKDDRTPLIIPACGHTFCFSCVQGLVSKLEPGQPFTCPEDKATVAMTSLGIHQFPRNLMVLNLVEKRETFNFSKPTADYKPVNASVATPTKTPDSAFERAFSQAHNFQPSRRETGVSNLKTIRASLSRQESFFGQKEKESDLCREHGKKLEFLCINHQCRICANCALVGSHRNHEIKTEDDALKEITSKADRLMDVIQGIENANSIIPEEQFKEVFSWKMKEKATDLEMHLHRKFEEYISLIKTKEEKMLDEINSKLAALETQLAHVNQFPADLRTKINAWKQNSYNLLDVMSEKAEKGEIIYDLLDDKPGSKTDVIREGEKLVREINSHSSAPIETLEKELNKISLIFNETLSGVVENLCKFAPTEPTTADKFSLNSSPDVNFGSYLGQDHRLDTVNSKIRMSLDRRFGTDNNLLNFEWKELNSPDTLRPSTQPAGKNMTTFNPPPYGYESKQFPYVGLPNITESFEIEHRTEKSSILTILSPESNQSTKKNFNKMDLGIGIDPTRDSTASRSHRTPKGNTTPQNTSMTTTTQPGRSNTRSVSPGGKSIKAGDQSMLKSARQKRKLKVPTKYEGVIDGLEADKIEVADLFDAELGDQGVTILAEYLKGNKKLKTLKLVKNKITDEGALALVSALYKNDALENLHLSQNLVTEKTIDAFLELFKSNTMIRTVFFNRNSINLRNVKNKVKEIMEMGVNISL